MPEWHIRLKNHNPNFIFLSRDNAKFGQLTREGFTHVLAIPHPGGSQQVWGFFQFSNSLRLVFLGLFFLTDPWLPLHSPVTSSHFARVTWSDYVVNFEGDPTTFCRENKRQTWTQILLLQHELERKHLGETAGQSSSALSWTGPWALGCFRPLCLPLPNAASPCLERARKWHLPCKYVTTHCLAAVS